MTGVLPARTLAPAKVNLGLFLGPIREQDGRHELVTVMQSISLADELTLTVLDSGPDLRWLSTTGAGLSAPQRKEFVALEGQINDLEAKFGANLGNFPHRTERARTATNSSNSLAMARPHDRAHSPFCSRISIEPLLVCTLIAALGSLPTVPRKRCLLAFSSSSTAKSLLMRPLLVVASRLNSASDGSARAGRTQAPLRPFDSVLQGPRPREGPN